jgi:hypothetical protein
MPSVDINWWAVIAATAVNMIVGTIWYSKSLYGKEWAKLVGRKIEDMSGAGSGYALTLAGAFIQSLILAHFVAYVAYFYPTYSDLFVGFSTGLWLWIGFVAITQGVNTIFANSRKKLWAINTGYFLVVLLINGIILASWH